MSTDFRTYHASQALELSELVNLHFARVRYGSAAPRIVRMREPDGPSTDAGRKARQPLVLVERPEDESGLVFGFVDLFKRSADLKGYPGFKAQHEQRFGGPPPLSRIEYGRLLEDLHAFLRSQAIEVRVVNPARGASAVSGVIPAARSDVSRPPARPPWLALPLTGAIGFLLGYLFALLGWLPGIG